MISMLSVPAIHPRESSTHGMLVLAATQLTIRIRLMLTGHNDLIYLGLLVCFTCVLLLAPWPRHNLQIHHQNGLTALYKLV
jgi:hypothetical protein